MVIDVEISEKDTERLKAGAGTEYPLVDEKGRPDVIFLKTVGGYVDMFEIMMMAFNNLGRKFRITIEALPDDLEIRPNKISSSFMSDAIRGKP